MTYALSMMAPHVHDSPETRNFEGTFVMLLRTAADFTALAGLFGAGYLLFLVS
jgi:hypothetical protein